MTITDRPDPAPADAGTSPHETSGPPVLGDVASFPSHSELARTLVEGGAVASLASLTRDGHPYASTVPISVDDHGAPVICVSELAEHTHNLRRDGRASLLVHQPGRDGVDPLALARATLVGHFDDVSADPTVDLDLLRRRHVDAHPNAGVYIDFPDFHWWRLTVEQVRYVGGFGVMGWTSAADYAAAAPDPVIPHAGPMIEHLNEDHADACLEIAVSLCGVADAAEATVSAVDRYGITFDVDRVGSGIAVARAAFADPLDAPDAVRAASVALVARARVDAD